MLGDLSRRLDLAELNELRVVDRVLLLLELGRRLDPGRPRRRELRGELLDALVRDIEDELAAEDAAHAALRDEVRAELAAIALTGEG